MPPENPASPVVASSRETGSVGPIAGSVIVAAMLLVGAFYFWGAWLNRHEPAPLPHIQDQGDAAAAR